MRLQNPAVVFTVRPLPTHEDLEAWGGEPKLIESGPRGICAYSLGGKYIGMYDMTGYGGNKNNEDTQRDGTGSGEGPESGDVEEQTS